MVEHARVTSYLSIRTCSKLHMIVSSRCPWNVVGDLLHLLKAGSGAKWSVTTTQLRDIIETNTGGVQRFSLATDTKPELA